MLDNISSGMMSDDISPDLVPDNTPADDLPNVARDNTPADVLPNVTLAPLVRDSSDARLPLLAFVADDETETALREGFSSTAGNPEIRRGTIQHAIKFLARQPTPRCLVVDISKISNPREELDRLARVCKPDVRVLVVGDEVDLDFYRDIVRLMGVAEYVHKPVTRDIVARLFVPQFTGTGLDANALRGGTVVAVCSARGGVGTTTVAINLALQLGASTRGHVALLDLHLQRGTTALMLGVKPAGGLRLALEQPERADALFLDRVTVAINERTRLISAEEPFEGPPFSASPEGMRLVLDFLRRRFNYVVVDLPLPASTAEQEAMRAARHLLMVMTPDLAGVRDTERLRKAAATLRTGQTSIVLNRVGMPGCLTLPMIEAGLGAKPTVLIPDLGKQMRRAANLGNPALAESASFRKAMALLVQEVSGAAATRIVGARGSSLLSRMFGR
jgi:pilus assembly protein CpaE